MMTIFRDRIQDMMKRGMTLEQVKAARPTLDYDPEFGAPGSLDHRYVRGSHVQKPEKIGLPALKKTPRAPSVGRAALDNPNAFTRIVGIASLMPVCDHTRTEFMMRRDGVDYLRCLDCDSVFEAEDLEQIAATGDEDDARHAERQEGRISAAQKSVLSG